MIAQEPIGHHVLPTQTWNPLSTAPEREFAYIDLSAVDQESKQIVAVKKIFGKDAPSRARQLVKASDVLVSTVRPNLNGLAMIGPELDGATASTGFTVLRANERSLTSRYLYHWLKTPEFIDDMVRKATGQSYPAVSDRIILESSMPIPSIKEQQRIAAVLDQAEALRAKRRQALTKLDTLAQSLFLEIQSSDLEEVRSASFSKIAKFKTGKLDSNASVKGGVYPFFTCDREDHFIDTYAFDQEALLLAGSNAAGDYSVKHFKGKFNAYQRTYVLTIDESQCNYFYLKFALSEKLGALKQQSKGTGTKYLTLEILHRLEFLLPASHSQRRFAAQISELEKQRSILENGRLQLDGFFTSLQYRAFRGEL